MWLILPNSLSLDKAKKKKHFLSGQKYNKRTIVEVFQTINMPLFQIKKEKEGNNITNIPIKQTI